MHQKLKCNKCKALFNCYQQTTRIYGPVIWIKCPHCGTEAERNMSAFVESYVDEDLQLISKACNMIDMAQGILKRVGEEAAYVKRKG